MEILDGSVVHERWQCYLFLEDVLVFFHVEVFLGSIGCFVDGWHVDGKSSKNKHEDMSMSDDENFITAESKGKKESK